MQAVVWSPQLQGAVRTFKKMNSSEVAKRFGDRGFLDSLNLTPSEIEALKKRFLQPGPILEKLSAETWY